MSDILKPSDRAEEIVDETTALLIRARAFVERGWCKGTLARNFLGGPVEPTSWWACRWCLSGALWAAIGGGIATETFWDHPATCRLGAVIGHKCLGGFNDCQETVEPVLAAFDRAIAGDPR